MRTISLFALASGLLLSIPASSAVGSRPSSFHQGQHVAAIVAPDALPVFARNGEAVGDGRFVTADNARPEGADSFVTVDNARPEGDAGFVTVDAADGSKVVADYHAPEGPADAMASA